MGRDTVQPFRILLFFVFISLCIVPISCVESSVSIVQAGSTKEPFDVGGSITYSIPVTNNISSNMLYTVEMTVGPDTNDYSISKKYKQDINVNGRSTRYIAFSVNFRAPDLSQGEFGKWASDKNDTSIWDKTWYHAIATPLIGKAEEIESYGGRPNLFKAFFEFRRAEVNPTQGSNKDLYSYEVNVLGSYKDNVSLEVGPSVDGPWMDLGSKAYTTPGLLQTLKWNNVSLDFDFSMAYYRFKGTRQSKAFEGPFWPVTMNTGNSSVLPERGLSNAQFAYSIDIIASKKIDVVLNVLDIGSKTFKPAGRSSYKNVSLWEKLQWTDIQPSEVPGSEGRSSYYFTFHYPGSESPFNKTKQHAGPDIVLVNFNNATVSPENGSEITAYSYSTELNTALPRCDVELQTSTPGSSKWTTQGTLTYDGSAKRIYWNDVKLDADTSGLAEYRFICGQSVSQVYKGPTIRVPEVVGTVTPFLGVIQAFPETNSLYRFTYTAQFKNWTDGDQLWVELLVRTPNSSWKAIGEKKQYNPSEENITWTAKPFDYSGFIGTAEYKFLLNGKESRVFSGPTIIALYKDVDFKDIGKGKFDYMASVNGSRNLVVDLIYSTDNEKWKNLGQSKNYPANTSWQKIVWSGLPAYYFYEIDIRPMSGEIIYNA